MNLTLTLIAAVAMFLIVVIPADAETIPSQQCSLIVNKEGIKRLECLATGFNVQLPADWEYRQHPKLGAHLFELTKLPNSQRTGTNCAIASTTSFDPSFTKGLATLFAETGRVVSSQNSFWTRALDAADINWKAWHLTSEAIVDPASLKKGFFKRGIEVVFSLKSIEANENPLFRSILSIYIKQGASIQDPSSAGKILSSPIIVYFVNCTTLESQVAGDRRLWGQAVENCGANPKLSLTCDVLGDYREVFGTFTPMDCFHQSGGLSTMCKDDAKPYKVLAPATPLTVEAFTAEQRQEYDRLIASAAEALVQGIAPPVQ